MSLTRPDLSGLPADVVAYIEALEAQLDAAGAAVEPSGRGEPVFEPSEPPTTANVISISARGLAKRTPRHLYARQRRGGMGVFDIDTPETDPPAFLLIADESATLLLVTTHGRAFRIPVRELPESPVRARGQSLLAGLPMRPDEAIAFVIGDQGGTYLCLVSERGQVRRIGSQAVRSLNPGTVLHDPKDGGRPAAACWSSGTDELIIVTGQGRAIRFAERLVPVRGCLGLRVEQNDPVVAVAAAPASEGVFLLANDGKGALRLFETFAANKAPGSGGKAIMKTDSLVAALAVTADHDLFLLSRLGKIIRFRAADVPPKEGAVQGVNCMTLRADLCVAAAACPVPRQPDAPIVA
jgi:DNA gyrase subunit A